ncbi:MAG TPA: hypothetical protein VFS08_04320 [Gemmatimonadaceae bacterium]|nr:hypothetical protein [Gemmatimonadaceae bacterium]
MHRSSRPAVPRRLALVLMVALTLACAFDAPHAAWRRGEAVTQIVAQRSREVTPGASLNLRDLLPFHWQRMYVVPAGGPSPALRDSLGASWPAVVAVTPAKLADDALLVFLADGQVIAAAAMPTAAAGLAPELVGRGFAPDEATFHVERAPGKVTPSTPPPRLVP